MLNSVSNCKKSVSFNSKTLQKGSFFALRYPA